MTKKENKHIKNIISKIEADKAPKDFTNKVMKDVMIMGSDEEALKSRELTSLLNRTVSEKPSRDFTKTVMSQINTEKQIVYKPLISKKAWFIISGAIAAMIILIFLNDSPNESSSIFDSVSPILDQAKQVYINPFKNIAFSPLLTISLLCLSSMLLFDTLLKRKLLA